MAAASVLGKRREVELPSAPSSTVIPPEILTRVVSFCDPQTLLAISRVSCLWQELSFRALEDAAKSLSPPWKQERFVKTIDGRKFFKIFKLYRFVAACQGIECFLKQGEKKLRNYHYAPDSLKYHDLRDIVLGAKGEKRIDIKARFVKLTQAHPTTVASLTEISKNAFLKTLSADDFKRDLDIFYAAHQPEKWKLPPRTQYAVTVHWQRVLSKGQYEGIARYVLDAADIKLTFVDLGVVAAHGNSKLVKCFLRKIEEQDPSALPSARVYALRECSTLPALAAKLKSLDKIIRLLQHPNNHLVTEKLPGKNFLQE